jgi:hypothetical protein
LKRPLLIGSLTRYSAEKSCCRRVIVDIRLDDQVAEKVGGTCTLKKSKKADNCNLSRADIIAQVERKWRPADCNLGGCVYCLFGSAVSLEVMAVLPLMPLVLIIALSPKIGQRTEERHRAAQRLQPRPNLQSLSLDGRQHVRTLATTAMIYCSLFLFFCISSLANGRL